MIPMDAQNPINYKRLPGIRRMVTEAFIDPSATFGEDTKIEWYAIVQERARIGSHVHIWGGARILPDVVIGDRCMIGGGTEIGTGSVIGAGSRIQANCFLPSHSIVGENVFIGPNVVCTDDRHPVVPGPNDPPYFAEPPIIEDGAAIGAGAVLCPGVRIGKNARVAAGAVVTKDVLENGMVRGLPARPRKMPIQWETYERRSQFANTPTHAEQS